MIIAIERFSALVGNDGLLTIRGYEYLEELTRQVNQNTIETGNGSPEGVVAATVGKQYMDAAGGPGTILYVKQTGSGDTGWVLV